jgi:kynurenine formamidase
MNTSKEQVGALAEALGNLDLVDLSHTLEPHIPCWPAHPKFFSNLWEDYDPDQSRMYQLVMGDHTGTHIDTPLHFVASGPASYGADEVPLVSCFGRCVTIDATDFRAGQSIDDTAIQEWERQHGEITTGDIVLFNFGWSSFWQKGTAGAKYIDGWPGLHERGAQYLADKRVKAVGADTLSIDVSGTADFPSHMVLLNREILIIENLASLGSLPHFSFFFGLPLKLKRGSGSPIRAVAFVPRK